MARMKLAMCAVQAGDRRGNHVQKVSQIIYMEVDAHCSKTYTKETYRDS